MERVNKVQVPSCDQTAGVLLITTPLTMQELHFDVGAHRFPLMVPSCLPSQAKLS